MPLRFEWDDAKARANLAKHRVDFDEARQVFDDPFACSDPDTEHSQHERRFWTIGMSRRGRLLVVIHTDRGDTIRIIGARAAMPGEREAYEEDRR